MDNKDNKLETKVAIDKIRDLAYIRHRGHYRRKPDRRPYIVHPKAVYEMLIRWGFDDAVVLSIAWGHDLLEEAASEERPAVVNEIMSACGIIGKEVLDGINQLSLLVPDGIERNEYYRRKRAYLKDVAEKAQPNVLVVKMADRLCNTLDFASFDKDKARRYLNEGLCLFNRLDKMPNKERIKTTLDGIEALLEYK